jgi:hypothetical protein
MLSDSRLQNAEKLVEWLRLAVHDQTLPASLRVRAGASCFGIAQDHHHSIVVLLRHQLYSSSFALLRVEFEAYVRGLWLSLCASENDVQTFLSGSEPPKIKPLLSAIEQMGGFDEKVLSGIHRRMWGSMCAYTHTGGLHVQRWNTAEAVEPSYDAAEIEEVLQFAECIAAMSALGLAQLSGNSILSQRVLQRMNSL